MIKRVLIYVTLVAVYPLIWYVRASRKSARRRAIRFRFCAELLSLAPFRLGMLLRRLFYERTLARCGDDLMIFFGAMFLNAEARVGARVEIRPYVMIGLADIGDHVTIAQRVSLISGRHQHVVDRQGSVEQGRQPPFRIHIGDGAWVGAHAVIMNDVGIGTVVGAGAVVVDAIPDWSVSVGVPARVVREIPQRAVGERDSMDGRIS